MSGGSYDYAYDKVEYFADRLRGTESDPLRHAFAEHLRLVAKAMHDIEWVDSGDNAPGKEHAAILAVIGKGAELNAAIAMARETLEKLEKAIERAEAMR